MMIGSSEVLYHKNDASGFKAIGLPYKGKQCTAYFVLPNNNVTLRSLLTKMNKNTLRNITKNTKISEFTYFVPKMSLESFTNLRPVLQVNIIILYFEYNDLIYFKFLEFGNSKNI